LGGGMGGGTGGSGGAGGGAAACAQTCTSGCCNGSTCTAFANQSATSCGSSGAACTACGSGQSCLSGTCTAPAGSIGGTCSTSASCTNVPGGNITVGATTYPSTVYCKTSQDIGGAPYPGGFCSRKCLSSTDCGANAVCILGFGFTGEADNFCSPRCGAGQPPCRTGYNCVISGTTSFCLLAGKDGGLFDEYDAGPKGIAAAGGPCTLDGTCRPPDTGACIKATLSDGGPSGYTGGSCTADCTMAVDDAFCGPNGRCDLYLDVDSTIDPHGVFVFGLCSAACNADGGSPGCRTGYTCDTGQCVPKCTNAGAACGAGRTCNTSTGRCQ
ncbi:MAG: hypothetical protein K1X89_15955, partial [Myxococcaceae bacterium]|nr:hypothetical protein [Myxococcaceae bacterium]